MTTPTPEEQMATLKAVEDERKVEQLAAATGEDLDFVKEQVTKIVATFIGLPGVTSAPLVMGPDYYFDVACHQFELGARVTADPIKTYEVPTDVGGTGKWVYLADVTEPEDPQERYRRLAQAQQEMYEAAVAERRSAKRKKKGGNR